ncbi:MAG: VWA domain-containing protein [Alphaproteobacteria bacterium]|nr:VWA domain-containing protein [Alphaproteobacteria bacterium]
MVAILDMSLSMTGPKVALTALAAAILRLRLDRLAVVHFDTRAHTLVRVGEDVSPRELVRRILEVPAQGYTNIESGLQRALGELRRSHRRERVGILMSDGVANMGGNPIPWAARYPALHVVQVGEEDKLGRAACEGMARAGHGRHYRAATYDALPQVVRRLVRDVFRS